MYITPFKDRISIGCGKVPYGHQYVHYIHCDALLYDAGGYDKDKVNIISAVRTLLIVYKRKTGTYYVHQECK